MQILHQPILSVTCGVEECVRAASSNPIIINRRLHTIKHGIRVPEVSPSETESKAAGNGATDVGGEWNCSHMHGGIKGGTEEAINGGRERERETERPGDSTCRPSNYSVMAEIIDVELDPSVECEGCLKV